MQRVEVVDALLVVEVEHGEEADDDAGHGQRVEDGMQQLHVDTPEAAADAVEEDRWKWTGEGLETRGQ